MKSNISTQYSINDLLKKNIIFCLIGIFFIISNYTSGQATGDPKEDFLYGEFYISQELFREALPFYLSTLATDSDNCNLNYRVGLCYSKLIGEQEHALKYLKKSVLEIDKNYLEGRYKSKGSPVESWLLLGDAFQRANQLTEASYSYYKYLELIGNSDEARVLVVKKKIAGLGISYEFQRTEKQLKMVNMGNVINSRFSDYNPVLNGDQNILVYTQYWDSYDRIMVSHKIDNTWSPPVEITSQIGSEGDCYTSSLSFDGKELYLIRYGDNNYDIYVARFIDGVWTKMQPVNGKINSKHQESSVCISADGNYLYFSSDRPGGLGGFDIYTARREGNTWIDIKNMGKVINSKKDEEGPYISSDGTALYYSSDGHETIGNMDIIYSELNDKGAWQYPQNIGSPINTTNDDLFYIYFKNTLTGFLSRDLPEGYGKNDIYMVVNENTKDLPFGSFQIENKIEAKLDTRRYSDNLTFNISDSIRKDSVKVLRKLPGTQDTIQNYNSTSEHTKTGIVPVISTPAAAGVIVAPVSGTVISSGSGNENDEKGSQSQTSGQTGSSNPESNENNLNTTNAGSPASSASAEVGVLPVVSVAAAPAVLGAPIVGANINSNQDIAINDKQTQTKAADKLNSDVQNPEKKMVIDSTSSSLRDNEKKMDGNSTISGEAKTSEMPVQSKFTDNLYLKADTINIYTIQVFASKKAMKSSKFISLKVSIDEDGLYRYSIGEFKGWSKALSKLDSIKSSGFPGAFIRNINTIPNYSK